MFVVDVNQQVVPDDDRVGLLGFRAVVHAENRNGRGAVLQDIVFEYHLRHLAPRAPPVLIADGEEHRKPDLRGRPIIFQEVAGNSDAPGVLQLQDVLDLPLLSPPRRRTRERVADDRDIARHEVLDGWIGSAEEKILSGRLEIVVRDDERPGSIPSVDCLRVLSDCLHLGDVRVRDGRGRAVQGDATLLSHDGVTMDVAPIDDEIVRDLCE